MRRSRPSPSRRRSNRCALGRCLMCDHEPASPARGVFVWAKGRGSFCGRGFSPDAFRSEPMKRGASGSKSIGAEAPPIKDLAALHGQVGSARPQRARRGDFAAPSRRTAACDSASSQAPPALGDSHRKCDRHIK
ncbi:hypothetical protein [Lysobacter gummosus]|uniref:hypothetical protein n=1 Tax=Lysobacter gummosus TaxID=262324 RepID=UPI00363918E9